MCGIAGALALDPRRDVSTLIERLTGALAHRGPDGCGFHYLRNRSAAFGHRRLSIVDLEGGAQPMSNEDGRVWVVLNGELYNHGELRHELASRGHVFRTRSDVEVLVHGWEEWGAGVLARINGMYAFALYDRQDESVWLGRDPVGVKPLYVGLSDGVWWFASELAAARVTGLLDQDLRREAFDEFLVYRFVPSPGTFYRSAWKVPPGHVAQLPLNELPHTLNFTAFAASFEPSTLPRNGGEWVEAIGAELSAAVHRQLMADVPVASLLSGGVDSTVITAVMRAGQPEAPQAYAVGFADAPEGGELASARRSAAALGVPISEVAITEAEYLDALPDQMSSLAEPIANAGTVLVGLLCRRVREQHKVALTGQGADEPLGGYPRHAAERMYPVARRLAPLLAWVPETLATSDRISRLRRVAGERSESRRIVETLAVFSPQEAALLTGRATSLESLDVPVTRWLPEPDDGDRLNRLLRVDTRLGLADDLLIIADHMSMASSVELRVPFLDLRFLALVEKLPGRFKVSPIGERKWLYRRAVRRLIPPTLRRDLLGWRARIGRKEGFSTPLDGWLSHWAGNGASDYLLGPRARTPGFLQRDAVQEMLTGVEVGRRARGRQLLSLYVLEGWLRRALP